MWLKAPSWIIRPDPTLAESPHVPGGFHLPQSGNMSGDVWGKAACPAGPGLSSPPLCTPHHRPGSPHPSSGSWRHTAPLWPSFPPAWPTETQSQVQTFRKNIFLVPSLTWCLTAHLAKAAFSQHGQEAEIGEFDLVHDVGGHEAGLSICLGHLLLTWAQLGFLRGERCWKLKHWGWRTHETNKQIQIEKDSNCTDKFGLNDVIEES